MVELFFLVVGTTIVDAVVDVPGGASITDLRREIAKLSGLEDVAGELTLYTTKRSDDNGKTQTWLAEDDDDADTLQEATPLSHLMEEKYLQNEWKLLPSRSVEEHFEKTPTENTIHILVVVPPSRKRPPSALPDILEDESPKKFPRLLSSVSAARIEWALAPNPCPQLRRPPVGTHLRIPRHYFDGSGVSAPTTEGHALLYIREEVADAWDKIQRKSVERPSRLWIFGTSGVGKSCAAFAFASCFVDREKWDVLWIHYDSIVEDVMCVKFVDDTKEAGVFKADDEREAPKIVKRMLEAWTTSPRRLIVFYDGYDKLNPVSEGIRDELVWWQNAQPIHRRLVFAAAMATASKELNVANVHSIRAENGKEVISDNIFTLGSWKREEYLSAIADREFFDSVREVLMPEGPTTARPTTDTVNSSAEASESNEERGTAQETTTIHAPAPLELVDQKFYLAGGSARVMFKLRVRQVVTYFAEALKYPSDAVAYLTYAARYSSPQVVSRLLAAYKDTSGWPTFTIVSVFAARLFAVRVGPGETMRLTRAFREHPEMDGFAFDAFVLASLSRRVEFKSTNDGAHEWRGTAVKVFDPNEKLNIKPEWNVPIAWNAGGYDAVMWKGPDDASSKKTMGVVFLKMSRSKGRGFTPEPFSALLHKLREVFPLVSLGDVELCYVVPSQVLNDFKIPITDVDFKRQVVDAVYPESERAITGTRVAEIRGIKCTVRVLGMDYSTFDVVARVWRN